jgi:hypothetical protein
MGLLYLYLSLFRDWSRTVWLRLDLLNWQGFFCFIVDSVYLGPVIGLSWWKSAEYKNGWSYRYFLQPWFLSRHKDICDLYLPLILYFFYWQWILKISVYLTRLTMRIHCCKSRSCSVFESHDSSSRAASHHSLLEPPVAVWLPGTGQLAAKRRHRTQWRCHYTTGIVHCL